VFYLLEERCGRHVGQNNIWRSLYAWDHAQITTSLKILKIAPVEEEAADYNTSKNFNIEVSAVFP
jgi:hypothetical protein